MLTIFMLLTQFIVSLNANENTTIIQTLSKTLYHTTN